MLKNFVRTLNPRLTISLVLPVALALIAFPSAGRAESSIFGPKRYTRGSNATNTFADAFPRCGSGSCRLIVLNGTEDGRNRISSATVSLNGVRLLGPNDFNQKSYRKEIVVSLDAVNSLEVSLGSSPGSFIAVSVECSSTVQLAISATDVVSSIWPDGTVSLGIPLRNEGNSIAGNVRLTDLRAGSGIHTGPGTLPYTVGDIAPNQTVPLGSTFNMTSAQARAPFLLTLVGAYSFQTVACAFQASVTVTPPPPSNAGQPKGSARVTMFTPDTATYPPPPPPSTSLPNAKNKPVLPLGPRRRFPSPPPATPLNRVAAFSPNSQGPPSGAAPNAAVFAINNPGGTYGGVPPDPTVAGPAPNGVTIISANTAVSYSTNYGLSFTTVNLTGAGGFRDILRPGRTDFFPENDGGVCCDQVLQYIPSRGMFVWLLQYKSPNIVVSTVPRRGQNRLRIAYASASDLATGRFMDAWNWFDITPATLGVTTATDWLDYPDMSFSQDWLYISVRHGFWSTDRDPKGNEVGQKVPGGRRWFIRANLNDMANRVLSPGLVFYEAFANQIMDSRIAQSPSGAMYFAAQKDSSTLVVFADPDSSPDVPAGKEVPIYSYCANTAAAPCDYSVTAPDGLNWNEAPHGVLGAAYVAPSAPICPPAGCLNPARFVYFAFDGGRDNSEGRPFPYVRVVKMDADKLEVVGEWDIWNTNHAYATPGLIWRPGSSLDDVAVTLASGGGTFYAHNAVGFLNDPVLYSTTESNATHTDGVGAVRFGDYFDVRNATGMPSPFGQGVGYSTLGYGVTRIVAGSSCQAAGCNITLRFTLFGRNSELFPSPGPIIK